MLTSDAIDSTVVDQLLSQRTELRKRKCFEEADKISTTLKARDIVISDNKDGSTTWEFKSAPSDIIPKDEVKLPRTSSRYRKMIHKNMRRKAVKTRGKDFAKWVVCQFHDFLIGNCTTILDIAGGKGEVSYYIANHLLQSKSSQESNVLASPSPTCVIIDPMPIALSRQKTKDLIRKNANLFSNKSTTEMHSCKTSADDLTDDIAGSSTNAKRDQNSVVEEWHRENEVVISRMPSYGGHYQPLDHFQLAMHLQADKRVLWLDRVALLEEAAKEFGDGGDDSGCDSGADVCNGNQNGRAGSGGVNGSDSDKTCTCNNVSVPVETCQAAQSALRSLDDLNIQHVQDYFNNELMMSPVLSHILNDTHHELGHKQISSSSTLLLGFHPDEPTADIVDAALRFSLPFVVVPCCVFPSKFSSRLLKSGAAVRSYEDFILFLKEKDCRIQECVIDSLLGPNNIALFMLPGDFLPRE